MKSKVFGTWRRRNHVQVAYVNEASIIKQFYLQRTEELLLREGVPRDVIDRAVLTGYPVRATAQASWAQQFSR